MLGGGVGVGRISIYVGFDRGVFLVLAGYLLFANFCVFFLSLPFPFIGVLVRLGHIALLLFFIPVICELSICLVFCG